MIWVYELDGSKKLTRIATSVYGSEFTGTSYYEVGDYGYLTTVVQHPYGESDKVCPFTSPPPTRHRYLTFPPAPAHSPPYPAPLNVHRLPSACACNVI